MRHDPDGLVCTYSPCWQPRRKGGTLCERHATRRWKHGSSAPSHRASRRVLQAGVATVGMRSCSKCNAILLLSSFSGRNVICPTCRNAAARNARHRKYGLTDTEHRELREAQDGVCAICGGVCVTGRPLAIDHDHDTGQVRGLLCGNCNRGLGLFQEDAKLLRLAVDYLEGAKR